MISSFLTWSLIGMKHTQDKTFEDEYDLENHIFMLKFWMNLDQSC